MVGNALPGPVLRLVALCQRAFLEAQWRQFRTWWNAWPGRTNA
ncbi:MAG: hypothetical protein WD072_06870 [Pirellulales bacterium]